MDGFMGLWLTGLLIIFRGMSRAVLAIGSGHHGVAQYPNWVWVVLCFREWVLDDLQGGSYPSGFLLTVFLKRPLFDSFGPHY